MSKYNNYHRIQDGMIRYNGKMILKSWLFKHIIQGEILYIYHEGDDPIDFPPDVLRIINKSKDSVDEHEDNELYYDEMDDLARYGSNEPD